MFHLKATIMRNIKISFMLAALISIAACKSNETNEETTSADTIITTEPVTSTTETTVTTETNTDGTGETTTGGTTGSTGSVTGNTGTANINNTGDRPTSASAVKKTGQYNSNISTPPPPNTDAQRKKPAHTYGDTAGRMDGANSVR
jgi:hypothetical protein